MRSVILCTATRLLMPMILLFSVFLLLRGHHLPGGGFVGGLIAAAAFALYVLAFDVTETKRLLRADPRSLVGFGLLVALGSGMAALPAAEPYLSGRWVELEFGTPEGIKLGTPLLFDLGIYLVVLGATLAMILPMAEQE